MPDDRFFHKRAGHSDKVNQLTDFEELAWRYYVLSADDFGVMRFSAVTLQDDHERMGRRPTKTVQRALERVRDVGLIRTFEHQKRTYCFSANWQQYQKIDYPRESINPRPPDAELESCEDSTIALFYFHPGGKEGRNKKRQIAELVATHLANKSRMISESVANDLRFTRAYALALAMAKAKAGAKAKAPGSVEIPQPQKVAHDGPRLRVPRWQHEDLARRLGAKVDTFDLIGWYSKLEVELARTGEPFADQWKWLQERLYRDAKLPLPNLMGREKYAPPDGPKVADAEETAKLLASYRGGRS